MKIKIRNERPEDSHEIHQLTASAFATKSFSDGTEPAVIDNLRATGELTLSLVGEYHGSLVGHVAFSPVRVGSVTTGWYGLGPVSVQPELQRQGVGSALINEGLRILREMGADGCTLIGDPNYYCRFGFQSDGRLKYEDLPDKHVQWLSFGATTPEGLLVFSSAFDT